MFFPRGLHRLVTVHLGLVGTLGRKSDVLSLDGGEDLELGTEVSEMETGNLLIEDLGENVDTDVELASGLGELNVLGGEGLVLGLVQHDLGKHLVGERARHDERRVTGGTAKVDKTTLSKEDDVAAVLEEVALDLRLDGDDGSGVLLEPSDVDLAIEMSDVADNGIVLHDLEVLAGQDISATSGGNKDLTKRSSLGHGEDLVAGDGSLEGVDGIDLSDDDTGTHGAEGHSTTLSDITESGDDGGLASNHDIGGTLDSVNEGLAASVKVVELGLGDGVVDVDGGDKELAILEHLVEVVDTGGGLLRDTEASLKELGVLVVDKGGKISTIIEDEVELAVILEGKELLLEAPVVLLLGLTLPGEDGDTDGGDRSGGVVLGGEDVARSPGALSAESGEGPIAQRLAFVQSTLPVSGVHILDEDSSLDGHVETTSNAGTGKRLLSSVLGTGLHQTGHLVLSELDLTTTECRKRLNHHHTLATDPHIEPHTRGIWSKRTISATLDLSAGADILRRMMYLTVPKLLLATFVFSR